MEATGVVEPSSRKDGSSPLRIAQMGKFFSYPIYDDPKYFLYSIVSIEVFLGAWNRKDVQEVGQQRVFVGKRYMNTHEGWDTIETKNDIALIKLPAPIRFNAFIQPAQLPKYRADGNYPTYDGVVATASGWGVTEEGSSPAILRFIQKPVMKTSTCTRYYFGKVNGDQQICISVTNKQSTCNGDSGGPLVIEEDGKPVLVGATSFGFVLGCQSGWPGVFTRITGYLKWIHSHTGLVEGL